MVPHWKRMLVATTLMMCVNLPVWAAEDQDPLALEETTEQDYVEVPVESIQQFVKIYGLVKANYVTEKVTKLCLLKPFKVWFPDWTSIRVI